MNENAFEHNGLFLPKTPFALTAISFKKAPKFGRLSKMRVSCAT
ncbi:hypothetical protein [Emticicia aquatica]|jgi:hypothetical protein|nr:hypothetical protein [Emticicia aquatica]